MTTTTKYLEQLSPNNAEDSLLACHLIQNTVKTDHGPRYNCWGYISYLLGWTPSNEWLARETMDTLLDEHTEVLSQWNLTLEFPYDEDIKAGTIISWWKYGIGIHLEHTSIVTGRNPETGEIYILAKRGDCCRNTDTLSNAWERDSSYYGNIIKFHHLIE